MVGFKEIQFVICGKQAIPVSIFGRTAKEQPYPNTGKFNICNRVITVQTAAVFDGLPA